MTRDEITALLAPLQLRGNHVIVHASLSALGTVAGGAETVCRALMQSVTDAGTLLLPAFTYAETMADSGSVRGRPAAYHPDIPVSREIGAVADAFRKLPGSVRSNHPTHSFAAWGRHAREVLSTQRDNNPLGPLKKLNLLRGHTLLLGTGLVSATAIHLAEERSGMPYLARRTALRVNASGHEERVILECVPGCSVAFHRLEGELDSQKFPSVPLPRGAARKIPIRYLLSVATAALERDPAVFICERPECASCQAKREALEGAGA